MRKYFGLKILLSLIIGLLALPLWAAEITVVNYNAELAPQQAFEVKLYLNTENEDINAVSGEINFPSELLVLEKIKYGDSLINFWIEAPLERSQGKINFAGIVPGGYYSDIGLLLSVVFSGKQDGSGLIDLNNFQALLNDGQGTAASLKLVPANFTINSASTAKPLLEPELIDTVAPEVFEPMITQVKDIAGDQYLLIFLTQDKASGVAYYEVKEGWGIWHKATSPYILRNQKLDQKIQVRAVDNEGNFRIAFLTPPNLKAWYENYEIFVIIIISLGFISLGYRQYLKRKQKSGKTKN